MRIGYCSFNKENEETPFMILCDKELVETVKEILNCDLENIGLNEPGRIEKVQNWLHNMTALDKVLLESEK